MLEAIALALGGGGFHQFEPTEFDYFHSVTGDITREFTVTLHFSADKVIHLPAVQGVGNPIPVHGIQVKGIIDKSDRFSHRRLLLDEAGKPINYSPRTALRGEVKEAYRGRANLGWSQPYARVDEIRDNLPDVWLLTPHNLRRSLYEWKTGPLQKLSRMLAKHFVESSWEFKYNGSSDTLSKYVGGHTQFLLRPDVQQLDDWLAQRLSVSFAGDPGSATTPIQNMGDGWQSLVRLAALDVLRQYPEEIADRVVLLAEEPETHLHPHLRRKMRDVLEGLAEQGWTVLTATHGPEFVSLSREQTIARLVRVGDNLRVGLLDTTTATDALRFQEKLSERGNHEMLFAKRVILCEGKDDCWAIQSGLEKLDPSLDLDTRSVSLVDSGSIGNLPDYAQISKQLGIPWCAVSDEDRPAGGDVNPITAKLRKKLDAKLGSEDVSLIWPDKLETCLGVPAGEKATPEWQAANTDRLTLRELRSAHPNFIAVCESVRDWIIEGR